MGDFFPSLVRQETQEAVKQHGVLSESALSEQSGKAVLDLSLAAASGTKVLEKASKILTTAVDKVGLGPAHRKLEYVVTKGVDQVTHAASGTVTEVKQAPDIIKKALEKAQSYPVHRMVLSPNR